MPPKDYTDVSAAINADAETVNDKTDAPTEETETPPILVKRVEILRKDADSPEVHYCHETGHRGERDPFTLYRPLWPRQGWVRYLDVADAVDIFVQDVPLTSVPEIADDEPMGA